MKKQKKTTVLKPHVVIFVEGETDVVFFERLLKHYANISSTTINSYEIRNLKGVSKYSSSKLTGKLQGEIIPKAQKAGKAVYAVCCSYDTDVFENEENPVVDWKKVEKSVKRLGIEEFCKIEVENSIEDWLIDELPGICSYLNIKNVPSSLNGRNGYEKLHGLFKKASKVYTKGFSIKNFIDSIDISIIRNKRKDALCRLEQLLNVALPYEQGNTYANK